MVSARRPPSRATRPYDISGGVRGEFVLRLEKEETTLPIVKIKAFIERSYRIGERAASRGLAQLAVQPAAQISVQPAAQLAVQGPAKRRARCSENRKKGEKKKKEVIVFFLYLL